MRIVFLILTLLVAAEHLAFAYVEMFAWEDLGPKLFKSFPPDLFEPTLALAANQGIYNAFLAAGLIWSVFISDAVWKGNVALFFLSCVVVAGIVGALTVSYLIFVVQSVPALLAIAAHTFGKARTD